MPTLASTKYDLVVSLHPSICTYYILLDSVLSVFPFFNGFIISFPKEFLLQSHKYKDVVR